MWLKLEFPLAGVALKQENTGRTDPRCSPFIQVKGFIRPAPLVQGSSDPIKTMNLSIGLSEWTQTHKWSQRREIALNSYKVRLQQGCAPGLLTKCVRACKVSTAHRAADTDIPLISGRGEGDGSPGPINQYRPFPPGSTMPTVFPAAPRGPATVAHDTQGGRSSPRG